MKAVRRFNHSPSFRLTYFRKPNMRNDNKRL
uniref:Uncharacterized protein n=2 Tax=unclassified Caudoviricetes TaxID=2788787 RepID=A0A8S5T6Q7_9CAUD|nr:MAG TPA: hypothetical protein [Myoviridae sp. cta6i12]DAF91369.1 MAG TPA: hypothetical protein [Myoviridae sp. ctZYN8]DAJ78860.1 MAG TPA: hypothetical protein [Caudoviricetes sp.]